VLLSYIISKPQMVELVSTDTTKDASEVTEVLESEGINYQLSNGSKTISVNKENYSAALLLLGKNDIPATSMSLEDAFNSSFSTTESEKSKRWLLYQEDQIRTMLIAINGIKEAVVNISSETTDTTILEEEQDVSASVLLTVTKDFSEETPETIANLIAMKLGNETTDNIRIADQYGNLLYSGNTDLNSGTSIGSVLEYKDKLTNNIANQVVSLLIKSEDYDDAEVVPNLSFDMNKVSEMYTQYTPAEDQEQGVLDNRYTYTSEGSTASSTGIPGTDSNDETSYLTEDGTGTANTVEVEKEYYKPNEKVTTTEYEVGALNKENSSLGIVLTSYKTYREADLEEQGLLDDMTFEEYALENSAQIKQEVDPDMYTIVSSATGIPADKITIIAWQQPVFQPSADEGLNWPLYLQIILVVLIIALLIFVVFKGTAPVEVTELEPELSVEQLLATTKENQSLENIEFDEKSETRKLIEKFVEENPEAVAQLLRNWLSDDWG
jgi:flagellar M-ring protein FliF